MKHVDLKVIQNNNSAYLGQKVTVCGWVRTSRDSKNTAFLEINDGTMLAHTQIVIDKTKNILSNKQLAQVMLLGAALSICGQAVGSFKGRNNLEINAEEIYLLGKSDSSYPLQKKRHTLEYLRTIPHLRVRTNTFNAMFRVRSCLSMALHNFFQRNGFYYVQTPIITGSDCEGAGEVFCVTTIGYSTQYNSAEQYYSEDFFGQKAGLTVSGQLEGEVMSMALGKIYTFGPTFRAENSNTARHAAEFWQIEPEVAFADLDDIMEIAADMVKAVVKEVMDNCGEELKFFEQHFEKGLIEKLVNVSQSDYQRLEYTQAIDILLQSGRQFKYPVKWGCDLQTEHERYIVDEVFKKPVFVINYPKEIKSFYMKQNDDGITVAAVDLLVPGVGEIIGGSERETDIDKLLQEIKHRGMNLDDYKQYLDLRRFGSAPHSGYGLGLERLLMYITGISNIRDTAIYPRTKSGLK